MTSRQTFSYAITGLCESLLQTLRGQLASLRVSSFIMVEQELENPGWPSKKEDPTYTLRIRVVNSGVATAVSGMLFSMNFEVTLMFPTYYDGQTDIRSELRLKAEALR